VLSEGIPSRFSVRVVGQAAAVFGDKMKEHRLELTMGSYGRGKGEVRWVGDGRPGIMRVLSGPLHHSHRPHIWTQRG